ncbi:TolC family protein [Flavimarina sp. Hel_I_48]|uniref:TolC family protein n=1 Tax=Flavimarina sp. Hel_I_48 TaxID=1392488 RepID=UPI0009DF79A8|nr:TolC family protein [Flavimarina sp. Hel_I_48]
MIKELSIYLFSFLVFNSISAQELQSYIEEGQQNNLQIQAFEIRYATALEKVNEVSLSNTELSAGYFASAPETRTGPQVARFSVRQMLPWFGSLAAQRKSAGAAAASEQAEIAITKRKIGLNVASAYYTLYTLTAKQQVLQAQMELLQRYEELALTSVEVGKASVVDVLKLQIRQNGLQQQKEILAQDYQAEKVRFNALLNRDQKLEIVLADTLFIPKENFMENGENLSINPEILKYDTLYEAVTQEELANRKSAQPMLGVGLDYIPVAERPEMAMSDNGKDILMPMLSVSIPLFNNSYSSKSKQNELRQNELLTQKNNRLNELNILLAEAKSSLKSAKISYFIQENNLKQAKNAEEILLKNYETGTIDFNDVLDIQELQLQLLVEQLDAVERYFSQAAVINYLTQV